ncbi:23S rRNA (uracil(1939)-C(5))-methyltransferase RlmD [Geosporobacter ferrireducens]|uniref:23S rRNA (uracil(1939)-C(5))-methyltransferase RlmD n=1 Tax=Geosporobacter ferrireducens TaxID=1424294 RepID=UPI00139CF835|nr:23S rRNA (uracil(1939)-C(5))-methyltransferase RlmD [Geosporobacter ferrireducens]MTI56189.1 23S rRNA (uracil(1939)-C(5))-methyltransferase RlmD [Geosporobacter ferrireducens]
MVKKRDIVEAKIEDLEFPSKGIARIDGKKLFVKNTVPGQLVRVNISKVKDDYAEGKLIEVLERSPQEVESFCEHFGSCGGCAHQTLPYEAQLEMKANLVYRLLEDAGIRDYQFLGIEGSPETFAYRNKMEYSFGDEEKGGEITLGMHKKGKFHDVVTVDRCRIADEDFNLILRTILHYFREKKIPLYNNKTHIGYLRHLVVRKAKKTKEILVNLVTSTQQQVDMTELVELLKQQNYEGRLVGFLHTFNDGVSDVVISDRTDTLWGQDYFTEEILGLCFQISAFSFFQTNSIGAEKLYSLVMDFMGAAADKTVFDLYCGTGTIGQIAAKKAKKVIGIEIVEEAVAAANRNARLNGLDNCVFIAGDVLKKIDELKEKPDIIILDPPRAGIHPKALKKILDYKAAEIIYVSCNPKTLAENLKDIQQAGYRVEKVKCMDMFPHTPHVETVVLMSRVKVNTMF